ncbi:MAG: PD40 domain-containing protein [Proteobacteria bacterium]|nr:PD40 domain-containing protein [Pseudomonadota bacterium]
MIGAALLLAAAAPPVIWSAPPISSDQFESHPAFDPWTGDLWFVRSTPQFRGWRIKLSHCGATGWTEPADAPIAGDGVEADPWFSRDGRTLWFISTRSTDGIHKKDLDIWRVMRGKDGRWGRPERLPEPVNSAGQEWFPRMDRDGWLYFGSDRPGGFGKTDIWRARQGRDGKWAVENAGPALNTVGDEYEPLPSPDGKWMLLSGADAYYRSERTAKGWTPRVKLGAEINANGTEIGAAFSPSGKSWLFGRDARDGRSGELMLVKGEEGWPKACPAAKE